MAPAAIVVWASIAWLFGLGGACLVVPGRARKFLGGFAESLPAHYGEQGLRLLAGVGFVFHAPAMRFPTLFGLFGWVLVVTSIALMVLPWRWHRRFARRVVPPVQRNVGAYGLACLALGAFVLYSMV